MSRPLLHRALVRSASAAGFLPFAHFLRCFLLTWGLLGASCSFERIASATTPALIRSSLADRVQRIRQVRVVYRIRYVGAPGEKSPSPAELHYDWGWGNGQEYLRTFGMDAQPDSGATSFAWAFDGKRKFKFPMDDSGRMLQLQIQNSHSSSDRQESEAANLMGLRVSWMHEDLSELAAIPDCRFLDSVAIGSANYPGFEVTTKGISRRGLVRVLAGLDPDRDWVPVLIQCEQLDERGDPVVRTRLEVDASMEVPEGADRSLGSLIVPSLARRTSETTADGIRGRTEIHVESVALNVPLPPQFVAPVIPDGITVDEPPSKPGGFPITYISGGQEAELAVLALRAQEIEAEQQKVLGKYGALDASPLAGSSAGRIFAAIAIGLLLAATVVFWLRRSRLDG
ncbi:MAG: hypothetical protein KF774_09160 [Planctomyces sp.]|nr:hypothetical protein [Planctomyces sp.]